MGTGGHAVLDAARDRQQSALGRSALLAPEPLARALIRRVARMAPRRRAAANVRNRARFPAARIGGRAAAFSRRDVRRKRRDRMAVAVWIGELRGGWGTRGDRSALARGEGRRAVARIESR